MNSQRGEVPWLAIVAVVVVAGAIYLAASYGGAYFDNLKVKEAITSTINEVGKDHDAEKLRARLTNKLTRLVVEQEPDGEGGFTEVTPMAPTSPDQIEVEFDDAAGKVRVRYFYVRTVTLPLLGRTSEVSFNPEVEGDSLAIP